jgi:hypothetical protein
MRKLRAGLFVVLAAVGASTIGCNVPGAVHFSKKGDKWEATEVIISSGDTSGTIIRKFEDRLNNK